MVTVELSAAVPGVLPERQSILDGAGQAFIAKAKALGVEVTLLTVSQPARVFPWIGRNTEFYRVSWPRKKTLSFWGLLTVSWTKWGSGIFRIHPVNTVLMPVAGERAADKLRTLPEVEEMAVLEERRIDPILAVRVAGQWYEAYRWWKSPVFVQNERSEIGSPIGMPRERILTARSNSRPAGKGR